MSTTLWKLSWLAVCLAALRLTHGLRLRDAATELGLGVGLRGLGGWPSGPSFPLWFSPR
jgi:hypothetical protein